MRICYSGKSYPSAEAIADALTELGEEVELVRGSDGDINWGRSSTNALLNRDITLTTNKRIMRGLFAAYEVPMPRLMGYAEACVAVDQHQVVVGRPDIHTRGRGLWICKNRTELENAIRGTKKKKAATHFMEFIEADHEYRVHIFQGKSIRISEKFYNNPDNKKDGYTTIKPTCSDEVRKKLRSAAKRAVEAVGLDFGAVDILTAENEVYVLEVNSAPGVGGTTPRVYAELFMEALL